MFLKNTLFQPNMSDYDVEENGYQFPLGVDGPASLEKTSKMEVSLWNILDRIKLFGSNSLSYLQILKKMDREFPVGFKTCSDFFL